MFRDFFEIKCLIIFHAFLLSPAVQITDEDVQVIQEMFPQIDADTIRSVLVQKGGDREAAISTFLSMQ